MGCIQDKVPPIAGVYIISDEETELKYIGSTNNLNRRRHEHLKHLNEETHHNEALQRLYEVSPNLDFQIIPTNTREEAYRLEQELLDTNNSSRFLLNVATDARTSGKNAILSKETKRLISQAKTGQKLSEDHIQKLRESHTGKTLSLETRKKMSESQMGHKVSQETRDKISSAQIGKKLTPEHIEKTAASKRGKPLSEETRLKMSLSRTGKIFTEDVRNKISQSNSNPVVIDGVEYASQKAAANVLNVSVGTVVNRLNSNQYPNWRRTCKD